MPQHICINVIKPHIDHRPVGYTCLPSESDFSTPDITSTPPPMPPKKHPHERESIYNSTSDVRHSKHSLHQENSSNISSEFTLFIVLSSVFLSKIFDKNIQKAKMLFLFYFTHRLRLLYRRKLKTSLHRLHPKHASPRFPPMRAIRNKDSPGPLNPDADACGTMAQIRSVKTLLNGNCSSFKNSELRDYLSWLSGISD